MGDGVCFALHHIKRHTISSYPRASDAKLDHSVDLMTNDLSIARPSFLWQRVCILHSSNVMILTSLEIIFIIY